MPRYYSTEDGPRKLLSLGKIPFSNMWENCMLSSLLGPFWASSLSTTKARVLVPWNRWAVACYLWLGPLNRVPGYRTKFVIVTSTKMDTSGVTVPEHLTDAYFKKKGTSLAIRWLGLHMSTAGGTGLIPGQESKILQAQWWAPPPKKKKVYISQAPGRWHLQQGEREKYKITEQCQGDQKAVYSQILQRTKAVPQLQG